MSISVTTNSDGLIDIVDLNPGPIAFVELQQGPKGDPGGEGGGGISDGAVTLAKQADVATSTVFYRKTAGSGPPEVQTLATLAADLPALNQNTTGSAATLTTPRNIDGQTFNGSSNITVIAPGTNAAASKATPIDADEIPLVDSATANVLKKLTWANLKAALKSYFDTLYNPTEPSYTWSQLQALTPGDWTGRTVKVIDIGLSPIVFYCDGVIWHQKEQNTIKYLKAPLLLPALAAANAATYTQSGNTVTVSSTAHAITSSSNGCDVYLIIGSGLATTQWFTNFTYISADSFSCTSSESLETSGTINTNLSETTLSTLTATIKGGSLGLNGYFTALLKTVSAAATIRTVAIKFGGVTFHTNTHSNVYREIARSVRNINSLVKQYTAATTAYGTPGATTSIGLGLTKDTSANLDVTFTVTLTAANDWIRIYEGSVESMYVN